jgi:hypothetical protein
MATWRRAQRAANGALRLELRAMQHLQVCRSRRRDPPPPPRRAAALPWSMPTRERARRAANGALRLELWAVQRLQVCGSSRCGTLRRTVPRSGRERRHERASRRLCSAPRWRLRARGAAVMPMHSQHHHASPAAAPQRTRRPGGFIRVFALRRNAPRHDAMPG